MQTTNKDSKNSQVVVPWAKIVFGPDHISSTRYDDIYFSNQGRFDEGMHVFMSGNDLPRRFLEESNHFVIGEIGFGMGLNFLLATTLPRSCKLTYIAYEKHPLTISDLLQVYKQIELPASPLRERFLEEYPKLLPTDHYPTTVTHTFPAENIELILYWGDLALEAAKGLELPYLVNAWFLDGHSPKKNPELWSYPLFANLFKNTANGGTAATYSVARMVRQNLLDAGFSIRKIPGVGNKKNSLAAIK
ncbi:MAG: tRNA (5-methylaminomethyl-2-thiouridine)(34)-methyltransferase MnmD [Oligoflexia bacterium]|nr:tRNA (5-methylaminomethyl-2-thiouridine)(34)-methyltransferase MnmD [Oligoflexia bacterium]